MLVCTMHLSCAPSLPPSALESRRLSPFFSALTRPTNHPPQEYEGEEGGEGGSGEAFDFEAHMAQLIERSERSLGFAAARGWEEGELEKLERVGLCGWVFCYCCCRGNGGVGVCVNGTCWRRLALMLT